MTIKRIDEFDKLEQKILKMFYEHVKGKYRDGQWRKFAGEFKIKDRTYSLECEFRLDDMFLSLGKKVISNSIDRIIVAPGLH